jgi:hypothetical protein
LSITSILFQNHHTVLAYLFPNCTRRVPDMHRYEARKGDPQTCPEGESQNAENALAYFSILSMLGSARTLNQWLKRTLPNNAFPIQ